MLPESQRHNLGAFGDSVPDASYTSYSISISKGTKEKDFWVGSIDIVQTKKQVGIFTSQSTLNPIDSASPLYCPQGKNKLYGTRN